MIIPCHKLLDVLCRRGRDNVAPVATNLDDIFPLKQEVLQCPETQSLVRNGLANHITVFRVNLLQKWG